MGDEGGFAPNIQDNKEGNLVIFFFFTSCNPRNNAFSHMNPTGSWNSLPVHIERWMQADCKIIYTQPQYTSKNFFKMNSNKIYGQKYNTKIMMQIERVECLYLFEVLLYYYMYWLLIIFLVLLPRSGPIGWGHWESRIHWQNQDWYGCCCVWVFQRIQIRFGLQKPKV